MDAGLLDEVIECLEGERTLYSYYQDAYASYLLRRAMASKDKVEINALRNSHWAALLNRPLLKSVLAECGGGYLHEQQLMHLGLEDAEPFVLTVGTWGCAEDFLWCQVSRPGRNLVLQLNLSRRWQSMFESLLGCSANDFFGYSHPLSEKRAMTLAWSRIDWDFDSNEILIEELQSDLVRHVSRMKRYAQLALKFNDTHFKFWNYKIHTENFLVFADRFLERFKSMWHEAMLAATLEFSFEELGAAEVYYHTFETGRILKNIDCHKPPKSLYTALPKKFCFQETPQAPEFLQRDKKIKRKLRKLKDGRWFHMAA